MVGSGIRDPGSGIRDGEKSGSGIRGKHPGSATLPFGRTFSTPPPPFPQEVVGTLLGFDDFVNMVLEDVTEYEITPEGKQVRPL